MNLTQERLKTLLNYNHENGVFTWLFSTTNSIKAGDVAGHVNYTGYRRIRVDGKEFLSHRLAWFYVYGRWPIDQIDHINGIKDDNRISNLRECSRSENQQNINSKKNSRSKYLGVSWSKVGKKWVAQIGINGKRKNLGYFLTEEDAYAAYCAAKKQLHSFNPNPRKVNHEQHRSNKRRNLRFTRHISISSYKQQSQF